jgi:hypothetical protein
MPQGTLSGFRSHCFFDQQRADEGCGCLQDEARSGDAPHEDRIAASAEDGERQRAARNALKADSCPLKHECRHNGPASEP